MSIFATARVFQEELAEVSQCDAFFEAVDTAVKALGFRFFALVHHLDYAASPTAPLRIHNYPEPWLRRFDESRLGPSDPVHRASHVTACGFPWSDLRKMIAFSERDERILLEARREGIGDGYTVPAHIPGEARGSISFAVEPGTELPVSKLYEAQIVGTLAYEKARRIDGRRPIGVTPKLTERQLECVMWVARGKTDWEIATILGLSRETVIDHLRHARERYQTSTRMLLPLRALHDGSLCFSDVFV